jgi:maleate isomerase
VIRIGVLTPHAALGPEAEFPEMAPGRVVSCVARIPSEAAAVVAPGGSPPTSPSGLRALTAPELIDPAVEMLARAPIDAIGYASTSSSYAIGFDAEEALTSRLSWRVGIPVLATCASAVLGLRVLGVERVALVDPPWFEAEVTELGAAYFRSQGFDVVSSASAGLSQDPRQIDAQSVVEWTSRHMSDQAEAVFMSGNGFRAAGAIAPLEAALGRPVLTSNQVLLWNLLASAGATFTIGGYGRLFAHEPPSRLEAVKPSPLGESLASEPS